MDAAWLGAWAVRLAVVGAGLTAVVSLRGGRAGRWFAGAVVAPLTLATGCLVWALVAGDFDLTYVAETTDRTASWPFRLAGLWGGMDGSLLFWTWLLALVGGAGALVVARRMPELQRWACGVSAAMAGAFGLVVVLLADPFRRLAVPAIDGSGLNPILDHTAMLYHPPLLYLGLVSCLVPFAIALGGVASGRTGDDWRSLVRVTAGAAWVLLTVGLVAGAHWAYVELGWGGFWAWDPIENAGLLPWLGLAGLVHAVGDRRTPPPLVAALAVVVAGLALLGAVVTRSGAADSVHAFAEAGSIGRALLAVFVVTVVAAAVLVVRARPADAGPTPRVVAVVVLSLAAVVVVGLGTVVPVVSGTIGGGRTAVAGTYFARFSAPLGLACLVLLVGTVRSWRTRLPVAVSVVALTAIALVAFGVREPFTLLAAPLAAGTTVVLLARRVRPTAATVAHLGMVVLLAGVAGSVTGTTTSVRLPENGSVTAAGYRFVHEGIVADRTGDAIHVRARLGLIHRGDRVATLRPVRTAFVDRGLVVAETSLRSTPLEDVLVAIRRVDTNGLLFIEVTVRPLVQLVWWGALLMAAGAAAAVLRALRTGPPASGRGAARPSPAVAATTASTGAAGAAAAGVQPVRVVPGGGGASAAGAGHPASLAGPRPPNRSAPAG
jgi:cytochrome c-type biogenesis protein CcmF